MGKISEFWDGARIQSTFLDLFDITHFRCDVISRFQLEKKEHRNRKREDKSMKQKNRTIEDAHFLFSLVSLVALEISTSTYISKNEASIC